MAHVMPAGVDESLAPAPELHAGARERLYERCNRSPLPDDLAWRDACWVI